MAGKYKIRLGRNIFAALRDFGLLVGTQKKSIQQPGVSQETLFHLLSILDAEGLRGGSLLAARDWRLFLLTETQVVGHMVELARNGWIRLKDPDGRNSGDAAEFGDRMTNVDWGWKLREAVERIKTAYAHIGRSSGAPILAIVYPPDQEIAVLKEWHTLTASLGSSFDVRTIDALEVTSMAVQEFGVECSGCEPRRPHARF